MPTGLGSGTRSDALVVELEIHRLDDASDPFRFSWRAQEYVRRLPGGSVREATLHWKGDVQRDLAGIARFPPDEGAMERLGVALPGFLRQVGWDRDEAAITDHVARGAEVHLVLRFAAAELFALPWELVQIDLGAGGLRRLADVPGIDLRYEWPRPDTSPAQVAATEGGRLLVAWSDAGGAVPAQKHVEEIGRILGSARTAFGPGRLAFDPSRDCLADASLSALAHQLRDAATSGQPYTALHLLAHGQPLGADGDAVGLALHAADGVATQVIGGPTFRDLLADHVPDMRLVVLCACRSADPGRIDSCLGSVAQQVHRGGVEAVVASRLPLSRDGSIVLTRVLYSALLDHAPPASLEQALAGARRELRVGDAPGDAASVQLYGRAAGGFDTRPFTFRPYRGLLAFGPEHRRFYFGRGAERDEVLGEMRELRERGRPRFQVVEGASGSGKSSLVLAGVVPTLLAENGWSWTRMVPGSSPLEALAEAEAALAPGDPDVARRLLVVDQFEELFTQVSEDRVGDRDTFIQRLWSLAGSAEGGVHVVCTMRTDFRGRCGELTLETGTGGDGDDRPIGGRRMDSLFRSDASVHNVFVAQMNPEQLRRAIEAPARAVGLELEPGLDQRMLDDVGAEPGALPLLEYALDRVWQERSGRTLTQGAYDAIGGVGGALQERADAVIGGLDEGRLAVARRLLVRLVGFRGRSTLDTRRRVPIDQLRPPGEEGAVLFDEIVETLVAERLLVRSRSGGEGAEATVEVAHEALIRRWRTLRDWVEEDRDKLAELEQLSVWVRQREDFGSLLTGDELGYARAVRERYPDDLDDGARTLIEDSERRARRRTARTRRRQIAVLAATVAVALVVGVLALIALDRAREARDQAWMVAVRDADGDPTLQVALLREVEDPARLPRWAETAIYASGEPLVARELARASGAPIERIASSEDGHLVAGVSADGFLTVWEASTGAQLAEIETRQESYLSALEFSRDGRRLLCGWEEGTTWSITLTDLSRIVLAQKASCGSNGDQPCLLARAAYSPDGTRIATVDIEGPVRIWNAETGDRLLDISFDSDCGWGPCALHSLLFSPDGQQLLTAYDGGTVRLWSTRTGEPERVLADPRCGEQGDQPCPVQGIAFTAGEPRMLFVDDYWGSERRGQPDIGRILAPDAGHTWVLQEGWSDVDSARFSPDGSRVAIQQEYGKAQLWGLHPRGIWKVADLGDQWGLPSFSPDGALMATLSGGGLSRILDTTSGAELARLQHPARCGTWEDQPCEVLDARLSTDATRAVTLARDGVVRVWVLGSNAVVFRGHTGPLTAARFSPDGRRLATASEDGTARIWSADGKGEPVWTPAVKACGWNGDEPCPVTSVEFSPDGELLLTVGLDGAARVWAAETGAEVVAVRHGPPCRDLLGEGLGSCPTVLGCPPDSRGSIAAFSPIANRVVSAARDGTVQIWSAVPGVEPTLLGAHEAQIQTVVFSPDGLRVVTTSDDGTARFWDTDGGGDPVVVQHEGTCPGGTYDRCSVTSAAFRLPGAIANGDPQDWQLLTTTEDGTARIWSSEGLLLTEVGGDDSGLVAAAFSPDGKLFAITSADGLAQVWDAAERLLAFDLDHERFCRGAPVDSPCRLTSVAFSGDGEQLLTVSAGGSAFVWTLDGSPDPLVLEHQGSCDQTGGLCAVTAASFAADTDAPRVLTASADSTARIWEADTRNDALLDRLWHATSYCLPPADRSSRLGEVPDQARARHVACTDRIDSMATGGAGD